MTNPLIARRKGNLYEIFPLSQESLRQCPDPAPLGRVTLSGFFQSTDRELTELVVAYARFAGKQSLPERLALIRKAWDTLCEDRNAEARAEQWAENAWLRAAEEGNYAGSEEEARDRYMEWLDGRDYADPQP
jgi:hypothetical protein